MGVEELCIWGWCIHTNGDWPLSQNLPPFRLGWGVKFKTEHEPELPHHHISFICSHPMRYLLLSSVAMAQMFVRLVATMNKPANEKEGRKEGSEMEEGNVANAPVEIPKRLRIKW